MLWMNIYWVIHYFVFGFWPLLMCRVNNLLMEPNWDPNISGTEPYWALKMKITKETFLKNQYLKEH